MTETLEDLLGRADALVVRDVRETETRCAMLGQYINDCEREGSRTAAWSDAVRELRALHDYRSGLLERRSLIQQALEYPATECPTKVSLPPTPNRAAPRIQRQVQIRRSRS